MDRAIKLLISEIKKYPFLVLSYSIFQFTEPFRLREINPAPSELDGKAIASVTFKVI
jgi:hypothetical protein